MKCPNCGSKDVQGTNIGKRTIAAITGVAGGLLYSVFDRPRGGPMANQIRKNICPERKYICLKCKHDFTVPN